ncbi:SecY-interacting protein [Pseudoalteromonas haloplanktis]|uniref:Protein Syd n=1 Tax=Pseudoalteromonas haloplanktis TaxID=228 RepID=A0ABU1BGE5_PSEHA|nr:MULTISPECIES: SecY-interacting protein [Pseudoalteromonas]MDQ9093540.1 SecY-interacting protein [Pseudoalteromonas haloplanktis]TMN70406.1 SecY-interacting protein [Pseudoalteromonas sp. S1727]BDF94736.1 protein Syd [Pseudoalteromonas sp. KAN5]
MSIVTQLQQLHQRFASKQQDQTGKLPQIEHDSDWPSPCEVGNPDEQGLIQWQAVARTPNGTLTDLANALEVEFPQALQQYYGAFFGGCITASIDGHDVELLQAWSDEDFDLLQQNITGHVLMKRKLKQPPTVFIGLTDQEDLLVSVLLDTGEVCLEYVGKKPHHVLSTDLGSFISALTV